MRYSAGVGAILLILQVSSATASSNQNPGIVPRPSCGLSNLWRGEVEKDVPKIYKQGDEKPWDPILRFLKELDLPKNVDGGLCVKKI
jgi:hypothetical protein